MIPIDDRTMPFHLGLYEAYEQAYTSFTGEVKTITLYNVYHRFKSFWIGSPDYYQKKDKVMEIIYLNEAEYDQLLNENLETQMKVFARHTAWCLEIWKDRIDAEVEATREDYQKTKTTQTVLKEAINNIKKERNL